MAAILVAGGAGYIGSQACKALAAAGHLPVTLDNLSTGYREAVRFGPLIEADLRDGEAVAKAIRDYKIAGAMHFAACSLVGESVQNPVKYYENNVAAAVAFTAALLANGVKTLIFSSTAAVYGVPQADLIPETHPTSPINPYGSTKLAFEQALYWLARSDGLNYTVLRYFNAAGADLEGEIGESHQPETHLIPNVCKAVLGTAPALNVFGTDYPTADGTAIRDFIHVVDLADAHIIALERMLGGAAGDTFNVGTGSGFSVAEVISATEATLGRPVPRIIGPRREGDPAVLVADSSKLRTATGWTPRHSDLPTIIRTALRWQEVRSY